jgi:hypothetical protein
MTACYVHIILYKPSPEIQYCFTVIMPFIIYYSTLRNIKRMNTSNEKTQSTFVFIIYFDLDLNISLRIIACK